MFFTYDLGVEKLAVDLARSLLGSVTSVARHGNALGTSSCVMRGSQESSLRHVSAGLESQVLALCGKCSDKIFRYENEIMVTKFGGGASI